jgi:hypothetical protein
MSEIAVMFFDFFNRCFSYTRLCTTCAFLQTARTFTEWSGGFGFVEKCELAALATQGTSTAQQIANFFSSGANFLFRNAPN